jgi:glycosyltransferase involved in cell wall biosynthesis
MKLFFDARFIRTDHHDGISRFSWELAQRVGQHHDDVTFIICAPKQAKLLPVGSKIVYLNRPESPRELLSGRALAKHNPDVVFSPMQTLRRPGNAKLILTLHDTIYYRYPTPPTNHPIWVRLGWRVFHASPLPQRLALNAADRVVTISTKSQREIEQMRLTKRPVSVVYNAAEDLSQHLASPIQTERVDNLVYMGSFVPYKNVETLVCAMEYLPGCTLHLLSRVTPAQRAKLSRLIAPSGGKVIFHDGVSDQKYAELLSKNACLVSASKDEGFGLPVVEAMNLGVPVVLSDTPAFREVAGDAALFFQTTNPKDLANKITGLDDPKLRQKLIARGQKQAAKFSWDDSVRKLATIAKELYNGKN